MMSLGILLNSGQLYLCSFFFFFFFFRVHEFGMIEQRGIGAGLMRLKGMMRREEEEEEK